MADTADVAVSLEFAAFLASMDVGKGHDLDNDDEKELYRAFSEATFRHGAGLVLSFSKDDIGFEGLGALAYMAETYQELDDDGEHGDSYRQACKEMTPVTEAAYQALGEYLDAQ